MSKPVIKEVDHLGLELTQGSGAIITPDREIIGPNGYNYLDSLRSIQYCALINGFDISLKEAKHIWETYSEDRLGSFLTFDMTDLTLLWGAIKRYFPEYNDSWDFYDYMKYLSYEASFKVDVTISPIEGRELKQGPVPI